MKVTSIILAIIFIFLVISGFYIYNSKQPVPQSTPSPFPSALTTSTIPLPSDWIPFTSTNFNYTLKHPTDIIAEPSIEGDKFTKLGPTQNTGTELHDGISLIIHSGNLEGQSLEQLTQSKHDQLKSSETTNSITDISKKTYGPNAAYQFRKKSLDEADFIYIQKSPTEYLEIINSTVEPSDREQSFQKTTEAIISSLEF